MRLHRNFIQALAITASLVCGTYGAEPPTQNADLSFAFRFFSRATETLKPTDNFVFSPISAERVVGAIALGAEGKTKREIIKALQRDENDDVWLEQTSKLYRALREAPETATFGGLWLQEDVARVQTDFLARLVNASIIDCVLFEDFTSRDARAKINRIIAEKTGNQISEFFSEDEIRIDARAILADVVAFDGKWSKPFDPESTTERDFVDVNGDKTPAPQMRTTLRCLYSETNDGQYVEIPYQDARFSFVAYLPRADLKYRDFESTLTDEKFRLAREETSETEIELFVPKFSVSTKLDLSSTLKKLGVVEAFGDSAKFDGIDEGADLKLDKINQGVVLSLDESGTKASATTSGSFVPKSLPFVTCDLSRPFVYAIRENSSGELLFLGRFVAVEPTVKTTTDAK